MVTIDRSSHIETSTPCLVCETSTQYYQVARDEAGQNQHLCQSCANHADELTLREEIAELDTLTRGELDAVLAGYDALPARSPPSEDSTGESNTSRARRSTTGFHDTFEIRYVDRRALFEYAQVRFDASDRLVPTGPFVGMMLATQRRPETLAGVYTVVIVYFPDVEERFANPMLCVGETRETLETAVEKFFTRYEQMFGALGEYVA